MPPEVKRQQYECVTLREFMDSGPSTTRLLQASEGWIFEYDGFNLYAARKRRDGAEEYLDEFDIPASAIVSLKRKRVVKSKT